MDETFLEKVKRVKASDLLHIFKFVFAIPFAIFLKHKRKNIWLLCDTRYEADDNAFWLFQYIKLNKPQIDAVFALDKCSNNYQRVSNLGEVVPFGSFKHWIYYLAAEKNISSQKMGKPNAAVCYLLEVYGVIKNKRAFLQHGVITSDLPFLHYSRTKLKLFVTSTYAEWDYVNKVFGYPGGIVKQLGLCRFDGLHTFDVNKTQILIMPTWRMYIRNGLGRYSAYNKKRKFKETSYYKEWEGLLSNKEFISFVEKNNLNIIFYPHREMKEFLDCFTFKTPYIQIASQDRFNIQALLKESAVLITDYSSVATDFAYMKKPVIYFQFDYQEFRKGHHPEGYFSYEQNGFGPVCFQIRQVIDALTDSYDFSRGFINSEIYMQRDNDFFDLYDDNNCKRNFEAILQM